MDVRDEPLISVIVPIYNVKPWLRKCLDSLKSQTLACIEVIMVDDGSTDGSGVIADAYCADPRFRVVHTRNQGLSAARNVGIELAKAEWLMFVDSDDWVDKKFCEIPYRAAVENGADLVIFGRYLTNEKGKTKREKNKALCGAVDRETAYACGGYAVWNKLYRRQLFITIRYPAGRIYEDIATTHKLIHASEHVIVIQDCLYYHVVRRGSLSHTFTAQNKRECFLSMLDRHKDLLSYGYPKEKLDPPLCAAAIGYLFLAQPSEEELYLKAKEIIRSVKGVPSGLNWKQKIVFVIWKMDERIVCRLGKHIVRFKS